MESSLYSSTGLRLEDCFGRAEALRILARSAKQFTAEVVSAREACEEAVDHCWARP